MNIAIYTNSISPHQLPLARGLIASQGADNVLYAYESAESKGRRSLGWNQVPAQWCRQVCECNSVLETCDMLLVGGVCPFGLMEKRTEIGLRTLYMSERWFKPPIGMLRLLHPKYFRMAWRIARLLRSGCSFTYLPVGIHAACDMARLCGLFAGDLRCLFRAPKLDFERKPGGGIFLAAKNAKDAKKYSLDKMRMWGYFVEPGSRESSKARCPKTSLRVLWVGRLLKLKRVDTIIRAVGKLSKWVNSNSSPTPTPTSNSNSSIISLDIYGTGPEEKRLKAMAAKYGDIIKFHPPVPIADVRKLMREHDVYVFGSNGYEGWGAVVSEALEEGMKVIGKYEAGASATMLPKERLFHSGEWRELAGLLEKECLNELPPCTIGDWSAKKASQFLIR